MRAYRAAAETVRGMSRPLHRLVDRGDDLSHLPDIGKDLAGKIAEIVRTGRLGLLREIGKTTPRGLRELLDVSGLGPRRVHALHEALGVTSRRGLLRAARAGRVREVPGFGAKTEQAILRSLTEGPALETRTPWAEAEPVAGALVDHLRELDGVGEVVVAGSFRRRKETVGDLDVLVTCRRGTRVTEHFLAHEDVKRVLASGSTKATVMLRSGLQVDLRVVPRASYGAALVYFTGSKAHCISLRKLGIRHELKLNEYGVFRGEERVGGRTEREVYELVGLSYVEPELREDRGELEAAQRGKLPRLVELDELRGDLHVHTTASDGSATIAEMAEAARACGHEYVAITEHTRATRIANGLSTGRMRRHLARIEEVNDEVPGIRILRSAEVDILPNGKLDLPASVLDELDLTVCAVHSGFGLTRAKQTERILRAMDDPHFHVLAHPTGRLIGEREPYAVDLERIVAGAAERGVFLELNAQPRRLDLDDVACRLAKEAGVKVVISTDAHSVEQLGFLRLGVAQARRGWLEPGDVLNTRSWPQIARLLRR